MFKKIKEIEEKVSENITGQIVEELELNHAEQYENNESEDNEFESNELEDNLDEVIKFLEESEHQPVGIVILESLGLCAPLLWLVYNCVMGQWSKLIINIPLAIVGAVGLIIVWRNYFKKRNENKRIQKEKNKGSFLLFFLIIIGIVFMLWMFVVLATIQEYIFAVDGWLFYANSNLGIYVAIILGVAMIVAGISVLLSKVSNNSEWNWGIGGFVKKHWKAIVIIVLVSFYIVITGVTFVTEDKIVYRNWLHPMGVTYSYEDVTEVKTGYKGGIGSSKGEFYYKACFEGRWISFSNTTPNESVEKYNDTYMEIEAFDEKLMQYHPKKISSRKNEKNADLDQVYIDRFNRIIDNK